MSRRSPFANPAAYQPSVYETYEPAPVWTAPKARRGWVPGRALLLGGWALLAAAGALGNQRGTDLLLVGAGWAAGGVPILLACRPFRRQDLYPVWKRPPFAVTFAAIVALGGLLVAAASMYLLDKNWLSALWEAPGLIVAVFAGLVLTAGGLVRWRRLTSYHWPYSRDAMLVPPRHWSRRRWLGLALTVLVLVAPPVLVLDAVQGPEIESSTAVTATTAATTAAAVPVRPVPTHISAVAWRTTLPDGEHVIRVLAGAAGPIAVVNSTTASGVRAYRGDTGQELWHYFRRARDRPARVAVTPDGRRVVVATDIDHGLSRNWKTTNYAVLDSARGTVISRFGHSADEGRPTPMPTSPLLLAGDDVVLEEHGNTLPLIALSLRDGSQAWSESPEQNCDIYRNAVAAGQLMEQVSCPSGPGPDAKRRLTIRGVSLRTGKVGWSRTFGLVPADPSAADLRVSADSSIVTVNSALFDWVLRPGSGEFLFSAQYRPDFPESPLPVSDGWVTRTGRTGDHLQVLSAAKEVIYDSAVAKDKTGWLLLKNQLVYFTYPDDARALSGDVDAGKLRQYGYRASTLTVSPLLTRKTRTAGSSESRITLSADLMTRIGGFGYADDPPVAVPGAVVVHMIRGREGAADTRTSILVGLR